MTNQTLNNINQMPAWELQDILNYAKTQMVENEIIFQDVKMNNYQLQEEDGTEYFELYTSTVAIDSETTLEEFTDMIVEAEELKETFKGALALLQRSINEHMKSKHFEYDYITNLL